MAVGALRAPGRPRLVAAAPEMRAAEESGSWANLPEVLARATAGQIRLDALRFWTDELLSGHLIHRVWAALYAVAGGASTRVRRSLFTIGSIDAVSHRAYTGYAEVPDALGISLSACCA